MKTLFVCASVLTLLSAGSPAHADTYAANANPYFAGTPGEEQGQGEDQQDRDENQQDDRGQRDQRGRGQQGLLGSNDASLEARRGPGRGRGPRRERLVCYSRNVAGRNFQAFGFERYATQRRAVQNCRARSGFVLGRTCAATGCRRY